MPIFGGAKRAYVRQYRTLLRSHAAWVNLA